MSLRFEFQGGSNSLSASEVPTFAKNREGWGTPLMSDSYFLERNVFIADGR
jgi:hypothetical protein